MSHRRMNSLRRPLASAWPLPVGRLIGVVGLTIGALASTVALADTPSTAAGPVLAPANASPNATSPDKLDHWSFRAVKRPAVPPVKLGNWARNPIDDFVLARLEQENLSPSPNAEPRTLIRRLYLDVTGLPPQPDEVERFAADRSPAAYARLVDQLLSSPQYGERWARHWLDVVRFAESTGFEVNVPRKNAWPYRDYVIRALNRDKPYDRFILDQLAGDTTGEDAATGFLVGGPNDQVKSPDIQLTLQQRADELTDMAATTGSAFLGLTVGCARCHNHKFDPISQVDFYSLEAVFAGVQHGERAWDGPDGASSARAAAAIRAELADVERQLARFEPLAHPGDATSASAVKRAPVNARQNTDRFAPTRARWIRFTILATTDAEPCLDELEVFSAEPTPRNVALASAGAKASASGVYPGSELHKLEHLNDGRYGNSRSWISNQKGEGWVLLELAQPELIDRVVWGRDRERQYGDRLATRYRIEAALEPNRWTLLADGEDRRPFAPGAESAPTFDLGAMSAGEAAEARRLLRLRGSLEDRLASLSATRAVYAGALGRPEPIHRLNRGDPMQMREPVEPGAISAIGMLTLPPDAAEPERRVALARWIGSPANPLTARVIVNRLWQQHFGEGLVATPSDFGHNGAAPTHPELLDWLASELIANEWRLKPIHRLILMSSAYRQSSAPNPTALAVDAGSRLLWRFPPRRLEAEPIRDLILWTSGTLDARMGGPGFDVFKPNENYVHVYLPKEEFGAPEWRRMIYQAKPRMHQDETFGVFDCPDAAQAAPRRTRSTTALQALNLLNSPFMIQQAERFAQRLRREAGVEPRAQARRAFALAMGRLPNDRELSAAVKLIQSSGLAGFCRALFNANEFIYLS